MSVSKDKQRGTWKVYIRYADWRGEKQIKTKRGFKTKHEAQSWEREFLQLQSKDMNMSFRAFVEIYMRELKPRIKYSTIVNKQFIFDSKITPYFGDKAINAITAADVIRWQNELIAYRDENGKPLSQTYLRTIQNQLSAVFNHAKRFYSLPLNPSLQAGKMGRKEPEQKMLFWTEEEYQKFIEKIKDKPVSYHAFQTLFYMGIREGELLALTPADFDFENRRLRINKTYQVINGEEYVTSPKTEQSNRIISMPAFYCEEMKAYIGALYGIKYTDRIFPIAKRYLHREMDRGSAAAGVKRIRIHDLRHSHVAKLINLGFSTVAIAERLGHKGTAITYMYAHLYPSTEYELADKLDADRAKHIKDSEGL